MQDPSPNLQGIDELGPVAKCVQALNPQCFAQCVQALTHSVSLSVYRP